jgi:branched-chain amino acid transport system substrate-binding protein
MGGRRMNKKRFIYLVSLAVLAALIVFTAPEIHAKTLYVGGTMALTGPYGEDTNAVLAAYEDYVKYVNKTKRMSPWTDNKFPSDITLEVLWRDDELKPSKALSIYEELKAQGMMVFRISSSPVALALKDRLEEDNIGAVSMTSGAYYLIKPQTVFTHYPIYTDSLAAAATWFKENWKEARKPRVAYLTADMAMGKSIEIPEMKEFLLKSGYEFVGAQYVPLVPTAPPTTQLLWLKKEKVDLALGVMINPGAQPTIKEAVRLGMGPGLDQKITFAFPNPTQMDSFFRGMGKLGEGYVSCSSFPTWDHTEVPGVKWAIELQKNNRPGEPLKVVTYATGLAEVMAQTEAYRLALEQVPFEKLKPVDVLKKGFWRIKNLDIGGLTSEPLTYGPGKIEGVSVVRLDQIQNDKVVKLGTWPTAGIYSKP